MIFRFNWKLFLPFVVGGAMTLGSLAYLESEEELQTPSPLSYISNGVLEKENNGKQRVVVLGTGWASLAFINSVDLNQYDVVVVSPRNVSFSVAQTIDDYKLTHHNSIVFLIYTNLRSIMEPIRRILGRLSVKNGTSFIQAECTEINHQESYIVLDQHPIPWVPRESLRIKQWMLVVLELELWIVLKWHHSQVNQRVYVEIRKLLNFVVVGGGPAGILTFKNNLDYIYDDLVKSFPKMVPFCQISMIQSAEHLLNTYDSRISECMYILITSDITEKEFGRSNIKTLLSSRVTEVKPNKIVVLSKIDKKSYEIPFGICVWATGVGPCKITSKFCDSIPEQKNNRAISTDVFLQVIGVPLKNVYAIGDCSTISQHKLLDHIMEVFKEADADSDDKLTIEELVTLVHNNIPKYPQLRSFTDVLKETFVEFDVNKDGFLQFEEFKHLIEKIDSNLTTLPATAQVANQQGAYLAGAVNSKLSDHVEPFKYKHLGSFAYIGHRNAVADIPGAYTGGGFGVWWAWRSIYLAKQFSFKNKMLVSLDWSKALLFGRDISRV
uniref:Calcium-binding EF-hand domain-containing protein n=1 Tax=Synstelium polycarpum TaxID=361085 RepID=A0A1L2FV19_9MYCE|nr:calcium-binding EF-hand domain-containing protein [Synstelium polycarpum]